MSSEDSKYQHPELLKMDYFVLVYEISILSVRIANEQKGDVVTHNFISKLTHKMANYDVTQQMTCQILDKMSQYASYLKHDSKMTSKVT